jgi:hypothetical protein
MLRDALGLTPEQLLWRRMQIRTQHEDNIDLFKQENPATDEEAFIGSGNPVFPGILVQRAIRAAEAGAGAGAGDAAGEGVRVEAVAARGRWMCRRGRCGCRRRTLRRTSRCCGCGSTL